MEEGHGCVKADLTGEIGNRAGRNSVNVDKDVKDSDTVSLGPESTDMISHHVTQWVYFVSKNQGTEWKHPLGMAPGNLLIPAKCLGILLIDVVSFAL